VIEARLSTRSTSIRIAYPRHIPMITPMLLSIYIHTTLPIPMPLSSSAAISLAAKFSFPGFIHGVVKPILPTPSTFCQANTPDPDLQLSPLNCYFRDGGAAAVIPCRYCFFRDLVGPDPSSAPLESVLYFPGRCGHAASASTATIVPIGPVGPVGPIGPRRCHQIVFFQAGGAASRPWKLFNVVPRKNDGYDNRSKDNKRLYPVHGFMLPRAAAADVAS